MENTLNHTIQALMKWSINIKSFEEKQKEIRLKNSLSKCYIEPGIGSILKKPEMENRRKS